MDKHTILKYFLPKEFIDYFELVDIQETSGKLILSLDEKNVKPPEHSDKNLESKGFYTALHLNDFPIRDHEVILKIRRRKWKDINTGKTYTKEWELKEKGTSYTKEFAAFLKKITGYQSG